MEFDVYIVLMCSDVSVGSYLRCFRYHIVTFSNQTQHTILSNLLSATVQAVKQYMPELIQYNLAVYPAKPTSPSKEYYR